MKKMNALSLMVLSLLLGLSSVEAAETPCHLGACVGDRAVNLLSDNRGVIIHAIDPFGKFFLRYEDNGYISGNWDRVHIALRAGCLGDLCVGFPAYNVSRENRAVTVYAIQMNGKFVLHFSDGGVGKDWNRWDLAVAWGCFGNICVNDSVFNQVNQRYATVAAIQNDPYGFGRRFLLNYGGPLGGGWETHSLALISRGPTAYPPAYPPSTIPQNATE